MRSTKDVIENHIRRFRGGNLEGILDDYSHEAMLFTPAGLLRGRSEIEALFKSLLAEFAKPGASDMVHTEVFEGEYAYLVWSAETADSYYELATDTFLVRNGKIVMQSFAAKIKPKR
jgi:ketosteroid isomerase-like protein